MFPLGVLSTRTPFSNTDCPRTSRSFSNRIPIEISVPDDGVTIGSTTNVDSPSTPVCPHVSEYTECKISILQPLNFHPQVNEFYPFGAHMIREVDPNHLQISKLCGSESQSAEQNVCLIMTHQTKLWALSKDSGQQTGLIV